MTAVRGYQVLIDWSNGGGYTGPLEDVTNYIDRGPVTFSWGRPTDGTSLTTPTAEAAFTLLNRTRSWDRWFSPENSLSPIAGRIHPGKPVRITRTVQGVSEPRTDNWATAVGTWQAAGGGGTVARVASPSEDGNGSLRYTPPGAVATVGFISSDSIDMMIRPPGQWIITFRVQATATHADVAAVADWYDAAGSFISTGGLSPTTTCTAGVWTTVQSLPITPPATAVTMRPRLRIGSTPAASNLFYADSMSAMLVPNDADKTYLLIHHVLDDVSVDSQAVARTFSGSTLDPAGRPGAVSLSTPVLRSYRTGDLINHILDAMGWTGGRAIDPGATVVPFWWEEGTGPAEAIDKLVKSEGPPAIAYVEGTTFVFRDRHHRIRSTASNTSQGTFSYVWPPAARTTTEYKVEKGSFEYDHGLKSVVNSATFSVDVRAVQSPQEIWYTEDAIAMAAGEVRTFFAEPSDPAVSVNAPSGSDIEVASGVFSATIDRSSGKRFVITLTCSTTGSINRLSLRGQPITVVRTVQATASDQASINKFGGASTWPDDAPWCNQYDAQAIADRIVAIYADNRPRISFTIVNFNDRYLSEILSLRIGDRITARNDVIGLLRDFNVERLEHQIDRLQVHRLTVYAVAAEPVQPANAFTFNVAGKGFNDGAFAVPGIDNATSMFLFDSGTQGFNLGQFAT